MSSYNAVPATVDFPALEREIIALWTERDTFAKSLESTRDGKPWTFYEGPPTANGTPGTHHIEARVFKDLFPRFKTMQGYRVDRKAGWDCHGLPVELAVEKELGFSGKPDIEAYGVEPFNAKCRESVLRHVDAFAELTRRMGYWVNLDEAYVTMTPEYVQSCWWALKKIFDKGLLQEDYRVAPYCPRCGTTLSDHELAQGYEDVTDPSVYVRFPVTSGPLAGQADLLVWTTTPWTLVSNTAIAVHPDVDYVVGTHPEQGSLVVAEPLFDAVLGEEWTRGRSFKGSEMERWDYQRPFDLVEFPAPANYIVLADYVTTFGRFIPRPHQAGDQDEIRFRIMELWEARVCDIADWMRDRLAPHETQLTIPVKDFAHLVITLAMGYAHGRSPDTSLTPATLARLALDGARRKDSL